MSTDERQRWMLVEYLAQQFRRQRHPVLFTRMSHMEPGHTGKFHSLAQPERDEPSLEIARRWFGLLEIYFPPLPTNKQRSQCAATLAASLAASLEPSRAFRRSERDSLEEIGRLVLSTSLFYSSSKAEKRRTSAAADWDLCHQSIVSGTWRIQAHLVQGPILENVFVGDLQSVQDQSSWQASTSHPEVWIPD